MRRRLRSSGSKSATRTRSRTSQRYHKKSHVDVGSDSSGISEIKQPEVGYAQVDEEDGIAQPEFNPADDIKVQQQQYDDPIASQFRAMEGDFFQHTSICPGCECTFAGVKSAPEKFDDSQWHPYANFTEFALHSYVPVPLFNY